MDLQSIVNTDNIDVLIENKDIVNNAIIEITLDECINGNIRTSILEFIHVIKGKESKFAFNIQLIDIDCDKINHIYDKIKEEAHKRFII